MPAATVPPITRRGILGAAAGLLVAAATLRRSALAAVLADRSLKSAAAKVGIRYGSDSDIALDAAPDVYRALFLEQCELMAPMLSWNTWRPSAMARPLFEKI